MRILVATDGSAASEQAVNDVGRRPWPASSVARVISVVTSNIPGVASLVPTVPIEVVQARELEAQEVAARAVNRLSEGGLAADAVTRQGDPAKLIVDEAHDWKADLIVVGSHGQSGIERLLLGSVAKSVVSLAPCSVEVVRRQPFAA